MNCVFILLPTIIIVGLIIYSHNKLENRTSHNKLENRTSHNKLENRTIRYRLVKDFRIIKAGDYLMKKDGKTYYWRPTWKDAYVDDSETTTK